MRSLRDPGLYVIAATMLCGIANVPALLAVPSAVVGLQALTLHRYLRLWDHARAAGAEHMWWRTLGLSVGLALMIAGGAFVLGRVAARTWL